MGDLREAALAEARLWIGTPYRHQASMRGSGCDCLGLVRGVWRALYGAEPEAPPPYRPDWAEIGGAEDLLAAARRHMAEIPMDDSRAGDLLVFRMRAAGPAKHCGLLSARGGEPAVIHAYEKAGVVESPLGEPWARRIAAAFRFPERTE